MSCPLLRPAVKKEKKNKKKKKGKKRKKMKRRKSAARLQQQKWQYHVHAYFVLPHCMTCFPRLICSLGLLPSENKS
jgi:hypothetical protein